MLDLILRTIEELSTMDNYSEEISENKELLQLVKELIKLPDKFEVCSVAKTFHVRHALYHLYIIVHAMCVSLHY